MPLRASLIRSITQHRWTSLAAVALWVATAASFMHTSVRVELAGGARFGWPALVALLGALTLAGAAAAGAIPTALRARLIHIVVLLSAPAFVVVAGSGGVRSPALAIVGLVLMSVTGALGYRAGTIAAGASVIAIVLAD